MNNVLGLKPKERIIAVATKLFYENDIHSIGVDRISEEARVSKRTLYKHFENKEKLAAHCLELQVKDWLDEYVTGSNLDPKAKILNVFEALNKKAQLPGFQGCRFVNTGIELRATHDEGYVVARAAKDGLLKFFKSQLEALGHGNPSDVAQQLVVLFDGSNAWFVIHGYFPESTLPLVRDIITR